jgi:hypothetical protein
MSVTVHLTKEVKSAYKAAKKDELFHAEMLKYCKEDVKEQFPLKFELGHKANAVRALIAYSYIGWLVGKGIYEYKMFDL